MGYRGLAALAPAQESEGQVQTVNPRFLGSTLLGTIEPAEAPRKLPRRERRLETTVGDGFLLRPVRFGGQVEKYLPTVRWQW